MKTMEDVYRVIAKGKPGRVVDMFLAEAVEGDLNLMDCNLPAPDIEGMAEAWKLENYDVLRRAAYPDIGDQLDAIMKGGEELEAMRTACAGVKARWPKQA